MENIEMVILLQIMKHRPERTNALLLNGLMRQARRYAHLAPNHLTEHARKIDDVFNDNDTNTTQSKNQVGLKLA